LVVGENEEHEICLRNVATGEGMCSGKRCELCKTVESQICTSETNNAIYVKKEKKKKKNVAGGEE